MRLCASHIIVSPHEDLIRQLVKALHCVDRQDGQCPSCFGRLAAPVETASMQIQWSHTYYEALICMQWN